METNLFAWHWIHSVYKKKRNTDRGEAFQLAGVTTAVPQENETDTYPAVKHQTGTGTGESIIYFNLDSYLWLTVEETIY